MKNIVRLVVLLLTAFAVLGCSPDSARRAGSELTGTAKVAIVRVPSTVRCIRIDVDGSVDVSESFDVTPGAPADLAMSSLPLGSVTFSGRAYGPACSAVTPSTVPLYGAPPVATEVVSGTPVEVTLFMAPWVGGGSGVVHVDFPDSSFVADASTDGGFVVDAALDAALEGGGDSSFDPCHSTVQPLPRTLCQARMRIKHVVVLVLENQSAWSWFATRPDFDSGSWETNCIADANAPINPVTGTKCVFPHRRPTLSNTAGAHGWTAHDRVTRLGQWASQANRLPGSTSSACTHPTACTGLQYKDVLGHLDRDYIPNFWAFADEGVIYDRGFEGRNDWSEPNHEQLLAAMAAECVDPITGLQSTNPMHATLYPLTGFATPTNQAINCQTSLLSMLFRNGHTWRQYLGKGNTPACQSADKECPPPVNGSTNLPNPPAAWQQAQRFADVQEDGNATTWGQPGLNEFYQAVNAPGCGLPTYSVVIPPNELSCHDPYSIADCQAFATALRNGVNSGDCYDDTVFITKADDWGGFYDPMLPPTLAGDPSAYGIRVPIIVNSKWSKRGVVSHQTVTTDSITKMVEDLYLDGQRLDPATMPRPDSRPVVRENDPQLGDMLEDFAFDDPPNPPVILEQYP